MSIFEEKINTYRSKYLEEQDVPPDPNAGAAPPPAPDAGGGMPPPVAGEEQPPQEEVNIDDIVDKIEKASNKPWFDLAVLVSKCIERNFTDDEKQYINNKLSNDGSISVEKFSAHDKNMEGGEFELDPTKTKVKAASMMIFEYLSDLFGQEGEDVPERYDEV